MLQIFGLILHKEIGQRNTREGFHLFPVYFMLSITKCISIYRMMNIYLKDLSVHFLKMLIVFYSGGKKDAAKMSWYLGNICSTSSWLRKLHPNFICSLLLVSVSLNPTSLVLKYVSQRYVTSQSWIMVEILDDWIFSGLSTREAKGKMGTRRFPKPVPLQEESGRKQSQLKNFKTFLYPSTHQKPKYCKWSPTSVKVLLLLSSKENPKSIIGRLKLSDMGVFKNLLVDGWSSALVLWNSETDWEVSSLAWHMKENGF